MWQIFLSSIRIYVIGMDLVHNHNEAPKPEKIPSSHTLIFHGV